MTPPDAPSQFGSSLQQVTELTQRIVHDEIELAKAEVSEKASKLARGAAVGAAAGVFVLAGLIYFLHFLAWLLFKLFRNDSADNVWLGYLIVAVGLFVIAALAGLLAYRLVKRGAPPTPQMAIDEAQKVRATFAEAGKS
jgi:uncharacterized membrane protein YqjE